jgi:hypothetical protein
MYRKKRKIRRRSFTEEHNYEKKSRHKKDDRERRKKEGKQRAYLSFVLHFNTFSLFLQPFFSLGQREKEKKKKCCLHEHGFGETARVIVEDDKVTIFVDQAELHVKRLHEVAAARALILVCYWSWKHLDHHSKLVLLGKALVLETSLPLNEISGLEAFLSE